MSVSRKQSFNLHRSVCAISIYFSENSSSSQKSSTIPLFIIFLFFLVSQVASMSTYSPAAAERKVCGNYDWIADYSAIRQFLTPQFLELGFDSRVLVVGCGTSTLSESLYDSGFRHIVNIDIDAEQVEHMRLAHADKAATMRWLVADACDARAELPDDGAFDLAIDKGTLDALLCTDQAPEVALLYG
jgi:SAM-dependent methyltransferase